MDTARLHTRPIAVIAGGYEAVPLVVVGGRPREGAVERTLINQIDGTRTIAELAALCDLSAREVLHLVTGMVLEGAVEIATASSIRGTSVAMREVAPPPGGFVDFADVMEELELLDASGTDD
jgi:hypothetical protein